jgi:hypothetical protein
MPPERIPFKEADFLVYARDAKMAAAAGEPLPHPVSKLSRKRQGELLRRVLHILL